jgi:hypothetical protein
MEKLSSFHIENTIDCPYNIVCSKSRRDCVICPKDDSSKYDMSCLRKCTSFIPRSSCGLFRSVPYNGSRTQHGCRLSHEVSNNLRSK